MRERLVRVAKQTSKRFLTLTAATIMAFSGLALASPMFFTGNVAAAGGILLLNEIFPSPDLNSQSEWVEVYNPGSTSVSTSGWNISSSGHDFSGSGNVSNNCSDTVPAYGYCVFTDNSQVSAQQLLANGGDTVTLTNGVNSDSVTYPSISSSSDMSYARTVNGAGSWTSASPSEGTSNDPADNLSVCASNCDYTSIGAAISGAQAGTDIYVDPGTYHENVNVNKAVTLMGAGADSTTIVATDGNSSPLTFSGNGATVSGFTITHDYTDSELAAWNFNNNGVTFGQLTHDNTLENSTVTLNRNGVYLNNSEDNVVTRNTITNNRTGVNMTNDLAGTQITDNVISDNWTEGLVTYDSGIAINYSNVTVSGNTFDQNWYEQITVKNTSLSSGTLDVSGNTFSDSPVTYTTSSSSSLDEPGFAAQQPVSLGGTATKPAQSLPTLRIFNGGNVSLGYSGKTLKVGADEPYTTIQSAVNDASAGDTIAVDAGTYNESPTINKSLTLTGAQAGVAGSSHSGNESTVNRFYVTAGGVTVNGFSFNGTSTSGQLQVLSASTLSGIVVENNVFSGYSNVALPTNGAGNIVIKQNLFTSPGAPAEAIQIKPYSNQNVINQHDCNGTQVLNNVFTNATTNGAADINFSCTGSNSSNVTVSGNTSTNPTDPNGPNMVAFSGVTDGIVVSNNTASTSGSQVLFFGSVSGTASITGNTFTNGGGKAVSIHGGDHYAGVNDSSNTGTFTITGNTFSGNAYGVYVQSGSLSGSGSVDASHNYWGTAVASTIEGENTSGVTVSPYYVDHLNGTLSSVVPTTVYVNQTGHIPGYDEFSTISEAVNAVASGGTVNVGAGNYTESSLTLAKPLNLFGPNKDANPNTDTRVSEATVTGHILVTSSNVEIKGLTLTDPNYSGVSIEAVQVYGSGSLVSNVTVQNNIFTSIENSAAHGAYGVMVQGNVKTIEVYANKFSGINATTSGGWAHAIEVSPTSSNGSIPQDVRVIGNSFSNITNVGNSDAYAFSVDSTTYGGQTVYADASQILPFAGNSLAGLKVRNLDPNHTLDLTDNWWGNVLGASSSQYSGAVDVSSWCTDSTCTSDQSASSGTTTLPSGSLGTPTTSGNTSSLTLPSTNDVTASTTTSSGTVQVTIPAGITISAPASSNWDGTITAPTVTTVQLGSTKTVSLAIQVGASGVDLTFDKAVRLVLPGQAGQSVGFVNAEGVFSTIDACVAGDDQNAQDTALLAGGDCYLTSGSDLVVWTKHFTTFVAYTPAPQSSNGNSSSATTTSASTTGSQASNGSGAGEVQGQNTSATSGKTSSTNVKTPAANASQPKVAAKEAGGIRWYWWVIVALVALAAIGFGVYRYADGTDKN
ncbi:MAG TPA: right-handed parallel beta-helix repeat-containing protein [Candidatus Saccharimonadales bacterium]|nr:right-handed parallel beta-helix repeat-containing protein [Candidatus Saccharimonadales bacterium]